MVAGHDVRLLTVSQPGECVGVRDLGMVFRRRRRKTTGDNIIMYGARQAPLAADRHGSWSPDPPRGARRAAWGYTAIQPKVLFIA